MLRTDFMNGGQKRLKKMLKMQEGCFDCVNLTSSNVIEWKFVQIFKLVVVLGVN